jgi:phage head maturation protease
VIESLYSDENGLKFKAKLSNTTRGKDVAELINDGALSEFSIGYRVEDAIYKEEGVRVLTKLYLYEFSVVSRAANPEAVLTATERKEEQIEEASAPEEKSYAQLAQELEELEGRKAEIIAQMDAMIIEAINI